MTRREFVGAGLAAAALAGIRPAAQLQAAPGGGHYRLFWGDLHNHNAVGYAKGSLERSIDLARAHLDFFAFTGHASWHDLPLMEGDRHMHWVNGFKVHTEHWPKTRQLLRDANTKDFAAFLGYEWHSSRFGDYCLIFPEDQPDLFLPDHVDKLLDFADHKGALAIPHHLGYLQGWRGANWEHFRGGRVSPVVEIMSEHGCTETDRGPFDYLRHSMGGRSTANTVQPQLAKGTRFGFVASSDDHLGYPGAYGEGVLGVWAEELSPASLFKAVQARRTYASSGERILLEVWVNGQPMGADLPWTDTRQVDVRAEGQNSIEMIELIHNGRVIRRHFPDDDIRGALKLPGRAKCQIQFGWGPWGALALDRICRWEITLRIDNGRFRQVVPCFQHAPFGEDLRDRLTMRSEHEIRIESPTTRANCFAEDPTKSVILDLEGAPEAVLTVEVTSPSKQTVKARLEDLIEENVVTATGGFTGESFIIHRLVAPAEFAAEVRWQDRKAEPGGLDYYYVRVRQHNGHMAWSSPVWIG